MAEPTRPSEHAERPSPALEVLAAAEAERRQRSAAAALAGRGLAPGDRVAFCLPSSADLLCAVMGAVRTGVVPVLLNATLTATERDALLADAEPSLTITDPAALGQLFDCSGGAGAELAPYPLVRAMHYTSGTTGRARGVTAGPWDERTAKLVFDDEADLWAMDAGDRHLMCSPMYHTVSIRFAGATLLRGGSLVILSRFDAPAALHALRAQRPTTAFMVPTHLQRLLAVADLGPDEQFDSLRLLVHAGSPCAPALKRAAMARLGQGVLWEFYGSTEGQFTVCSPDEWLAHPGTVGRARPGRTLSILTAPPGGDGSPGPARGAPAPEQPAAAGEVGTIWCHAPEFTRFAYWRDEPATRAAYRGDAFTVGDLGHLTGDGLLFLSGRRHDLVISGGVNVYPAEVEAVLCEVPGVREVAVFGRPDEQWGQRVCAAVVGGPGLRQEDLRRVAADRLAPHKRPKEYLLVADLPHTATGKLLRREVPSHLGLPEA